MKLSISNIGWAAKDDINIYVLMKEYGYSGLEIAPTRIFSNNPYDKLEDVKIWSENLKREHNFVISSMQSIWYGRSENIFGTENERKILIDYTKKAIKFAAIIGCKNLVFGCSRNRRIMEETDAELAISFFKEIGDYAASQGTVIGMEANPSIYNTNYINDTISALELIQQVDSKGFMLNLDVGTMIQNGEMVKELVGNVRLVNHVHISEPGLKRIKRREIHEELYDILKIEGYQGFISIEMEKTDNMLEVEEVLQYVNSIFER